jgi:hypothetical protein
MIFRLWSFLNSPSVYAESVRLLKNYRYHQSHIRLLIVYAGPFDEVISGMDILQKLDLMDNASKSDKMIVTKRGLLS